MGSLRVSAPSILTSSSPPTDTTSGFDPLGRTTPRHSRTLAGLLSDRRRDIPSTSFDLRCYRETEKRGRGRISVMSSGHPNGDPRRRVSLRLGTDRSHESVLIPPTRPLGPVTRNGPLLVLSIPDVRTTRSRGTSTRDWIPNTFSVRKDQPPRYRRPQSHKSLGSGDPEVYPNSSPRRV